MSSSSKLRPHLTVIIIYNLSCLYRDSAHIHPPLNQFFTPNHNSILASYVLNGTLAEVGHSFQDAMRNRY